MPFLNELVVKPATGREWELVEPLRYMTSGGRIIEVPAGFVCDLASIPAIARPLFPVNGEWTEAAVVHDWLYDSQIGTRKEADRIFLEAMTELGVSRWRRRAMYSAVRIGGWVSWNN